MKPLCILLLGAVLFVRLTMAADPKPEPRGTPERPRIDSPAEARRKMRDAAEARQTDGKILRDLAYVTNGHERHKLDLYLPKNATNAPLIVWIHGGAWLEGDKDRTPAQIFVEEGYAVASINYRLSQHAVFPAQIIDCKSAIRWLRVHAKDYGYNPDRMVAWGTSAGGHLVALLGTAGDVKEFDTGENLGVSSRVQAVVDFFGPTDFTQMSRFPSTIKHDAPDSPESKLIGGAVPDNRAKAARANPITYVTADDPPFLIMHGDKDQLVPVNQSELLEAALKKAGVDVTFHVVKGAGHGFGGPEINEKVRAFLAKHITK